MGAELLFVSVNCWLALCVPDGVEPKSSEGEEGDSKGRDTLTATGIEMAFPEGGVYLATAYPVPGPTGVTTPRELTARVEEPIVEKETYEERLASNTEPSANVAWTLTDIAWPMDSKVTCVGLTEILIGSSLRSTSI